MTTKVLQPNDVTDFHQLAWLDRRDDPRTRFMKVGCVREQTPLQDKGHDENVPPNPNAVSVMSVQELRDLQRNINQDLAVPRG